MLKRYNGKRGDRIHSNGFAQSIEMHGCHVSLWMLLSIFYVEKKPRQHVSTRFSTTEILTPLDTVISVSSITGPMVCDTCISSSNSLLSLATKWIRRVSNCCEIAFLTVPDILAPFNCTDSRRVMMTPRSLVILTGIGRESFKINSAPAMASPEINDMIAS